MSSNPWINHIKKVQRANPKLSFGEAMHKAKKSYQQQGGVVTRSGLNTQRKIASSKKSPSSRKSASRKSRSCSRLHRKPYSLFGKSRVVPPYRAKNCKTSGTQVGWSRKKPRTEQEFMPHQTSSGRWTWKQQA